MVRVNEPDNLNEMDKSIGIKTVKVTQEEIQNLHRPDQI
jgi:hypothetical protein